MNFSNNRITLVAALAALACVTATASASVVIASGQRNIAIVPTGQVAFIDNTSPNFIGTQALAGTGAAKSAFGASTFTVTGSGFVVSDLNMARVNDGATAVYGSIIFDVVGEPTNYNIVGDMAFSENARPAALSSMFTTLELIPESGPNVTLASFREQNTNTNTRVGELFLGDHADLGTGSLYGPLPIGRYKWYYSFFLDDTGILNTSTTSATATGSIQINFSSVGAPEPASVGILAFAAGSLLLRRRR